VREEKLSAGGDRGAARAAQRSRNITLVSPFLRFFYDLATGNWSIETTRDLPALRLEAVGRVELLDPDGQRIERNVASSALLRLAPFGDLSTDTRLWIEAERRWPDGLSVIQSFELDRTSAELTATLSVRPTQRVAFAVRSIAPLSPPEAQTANLFASAGFESVLDVGWSALTPAREWLLTDSADIVATGLAGLGGHLDPRGIVLAFLDGRDVVGEYRIRRTALRGEFIGDQGDAPVIVSARAWTGDVEFGPDGVSSGPLWLCIDRADAALCRFAELQRGRLRAQSSDDTSADPALDRRDDRHSTVWLAARAASYEASVIGSGRESAGPCERTLGQVADQGTAIAPEPLAPTSRFDERSVLDALARATAARLTPAVDHALVPSGWQLDEGDWQPDPARFPHGMRAIADVVHDARVKAALSFSPLIVRRSSSIFRDHPTWLLRDESGDPIPAGDADRFVLDATQPAVRDWLRALGRLITADWRFDSVRIESPNVVVDGGWRANGNTSPLAAFRDALDAVCYGVAGRPIVSAGGPLFAALDLAAIVETDARPLRRAVPSPLIRAFLALCGPITCAGPLLVNAADQSLDEAKAAATIAAFGGGALALGDAADGLLPLERARVVQVCLSPVPAVVMPLAPFAPGGARLFSARIRRSWDDWRLIVALNPLEHPMAIVASLDALGIDGPLHAFEFWTQTYLGTTSNRLVVDQVPAGGCRVIALRAQQAQPQVIGTSLHVGLGAVELQDVQWVEETSDLRLTLTAVGDREGTVTIAVPRGWSIGTVRGTGGHFSLRQLGDRLLQINCHFRDVGEAQVNFWRTTK
jgi:hypothetical protein